MRTGRAGAPELRQGDPYRVCAAFAPGCAGAALWARPARARSSRPPRQAGRTTWWTAGAPSWWIGSSRTYAPGSGAWIIKP
ncbi:hypothetical protein ACE1SV_23430 [Streptomyces sennicomposti]